MDTKEKTVEIARLLFEVGKTIRDSMRRGFEEKGITMPQGFVMGTLIKHGEMKITDLSREINLSNSTISGIIDRLEKQQLVIRRRSEDDRRVVYVKVSPKFEEIHEGFHKKAEENIRDMLSTATSEEIEKVVEGLNVLKRVLDNKNK